MSDPVVLCLPAPAKINLFLHVTGRRADGYHDIQTLFQLLDWGDELRLRVTPGPAVSRAPAEYGVAEADDLVARAAKLLQSATGSGHGVEITVNKQIPLGSGLGGGSSDAATVLVGLNRLWACGLSVDELARLGLELGADVPVFIRGRSALAHGVGEELEPVILGERHYVLVFPEFSVSTGAVFSDPGLRRDSKPVTRPGAIAGEGRNDCEEVVCRRFPAFAALMKDLEQWGQPRMTGTGSAIFLAMRDRKSANSTARAMKTLYNVRAVRGVDMSPLHEKMGSR